MNREPTGQFLPGPMSEDMKQRISEGQRRRHALIRELEADAPPVDKKRCTQCKQWKRVNLKDPPESEFTIRRRTLRDGTERRSPAGECKKCAAERRRRWEVGQGKEQVRERQRRWNANRDQEARRRYNREWGRIRRMEQGVMPRGPWKRYRNEIPGEDGMVLDATALVERIRPRLGYGNHDSAPLRVEGKDYIDVEALRRMHQLPTYEDVAARAGVSLYRLSKVMTGQRKWLTPHEAERILWAVGLDSDVLFELYPDLA